MFLPADSNEAYLVPSANVLSVCPHGPVAYVFMALARGRIKFDLAELPEQSCFHVKSVKYPVANLFGALLRKY